MSKYVLITLIGMIGAVHSCKKDDVGGIPFVPVDISINVNLPEHISIAVPGGSEQIGGGSRGIIIYRASFNEFIAYERHCPYRPEDLCAVGIDSTLTTATDLACCSTSYLLINGSVTQGPGSLPLQQYNTTFNGTTLRIFN